MTRTALLKLEELRLQLEMTFAGADDKYVPPEFVPADQLPVGPERFRSDVARTVAGIPALASTVGLAAQTLSDARAMLVGATREAQDLLGRKQQLGFVKKAVSATEREVSDAVQVLTRLTSSLEKHRAALKQVSDRADARKWTR